MKIDHVFLRAKRNAPEADLLCEFGLVEGSGNRHPGQGTENRRFFFRNAFIEFLWMCDESEVNSDVTRPTMLYERLTDSSASPFGVCFRPGWCPTTWCMKTSPEMAFMKATRRWSL